MKPTPVAFIQEISRPFYRPSLSPPLGHTLSELSHPLEAAASRQGDNATKETPFHHSTNKPKRALFDLNDENYVT